MNRMKFHLNWVSREQRLETGNTEMMLMMLSAEGGADTLVEKIEKHVETEKERERKLWE